MGVIVHAKTMFCNGWVERAEQNILLLGSRNVNDPTYTTLEVCCKHTGDAQLQFVAHRFKRNAVPRGVRFVRRIGSDATTFPQEYLAVVG